MKEEKKENTVQPETAKQPAPTVIVPVKGRGRWPYVVGSVILGAGLTVGGLWLIDRNGVFATEGGNPSPGSADKTPTPQRVRLETVIPTGVVTSTVATKTELKAEQFILSGFPDKVDATNVLAAKGADNYGNVFTNTIGLGLNMIFADPGVLKVGPEFPEAQLKALGKSVERYNPANQAVISTETGSWSVREGGFTLINGNDMTIEVAGNDKTKSFKVALGGDETNHWIVAIRGLFPDGKTPSDRNRTVKITNHPAGHTLVDSYPLGAYISEAQLKQIVANAHSEYPNSGDAGSPVVRILGIDLNTGAYVVVEQNGSTGVWKSLGRNW